MIQEPEMAKGGPATWFCVQTQPKHEHIAAAQLRQDLKIDVFLPRIRYRRSTRCGPAWVTEALFPNYLFAHFDLASQLRQVQAVRGVRNVVHFGTRWPTIPEMAITELRSAMGAEEVRILSQDLNPGDTVEVADGVFHGLQAMVTKIIPQRQRISILLDFLGRQTAVELDRSQVIRNREIRMEQEMGMVRHRSETSRKK
jgi:transcriptional antiterminator RfaH